MRESTEGAGRRVIGGGNHGEDGVATAVAVLAPSPGKDAVGILPEDLDAMLSPGGEPRGRVHLGPPAQGRDAAHDSTNDAGSGVAPGC